jgi:hypothetical protein
MEWKIATSRCVVGAAFQSAPARIATRCYCRLDVWVLPRPRGPMQRGSHTPHAYPCRSLGPLAAPSLRDTRRASTADPYRAPAAAAGHAGSLALPCLRLLQFGAKRWVPARCSTPIKRRHLLSSCLHADTARLAGRRPPLKAAGRSSTSGLVFRRLSPPPSHYSPTRASRAPRCPGGAGATPDHHPQRSPSAGIAKHHRRSLLYRHQPTAWNPMWAYTTPSPFPSQSEPSLTGIELPSPAMASGTQLQSKFSPWGPICEI